MVSPQVAERIRKPHWSLARTWLLQPGVPDGCEAFDDAASGSADAVVLDIEDGLPDFQKAAGRHAVAEWLTAGGRAWVRINTAGTPIWSADLDALAGVPGLVGVMLAVMVGDGVRASCCARITPEIPRPPNHNTRMIRIPTMAPPP